MTSKLNTVQQFPFGHQDDDIWSWFFPWRRRRSRRTSGLSLARWVLLIAAMAWATASFADPEAPVKPTATPTTPTTGAGSNPTPPPPVDADPFAPAADATPAQPVAKTKKELAAEAKAAKAAEAKAAKEAKAAELKAAKEAKAAKAAEAKAAKEAKAAEAKAAKEAAKAAKAGATAPVAAAPAAATPAAPAGDDAIAKAKEAYLAGKGLFDAGEYTAAAEKFKESYRLSRNPLLLYNIALTHEKLGDDERAIFYLNKFLGDAPLDASPRPDAEARLASLQEKLNPKKTKRRPSQYTVEADFAHEVVTELPPGKPADFEVEVPSDARWSITLFYRPAGKSTWKRSRFAAGEEDTWYARVPASAFRASALQYYIEVKGNDGTLLTRSGGITSPNIISITDDAEPMIAEAQPVPKKSRRGDDEERADDAESDEESAGARQRSGGMALFTPGTKTFSKTKWIATSVGAGGLTLGLTFALISTNKASKLEGNAVRSRGTACNGGPPCLQWDDTQRKLQSSGKSFETWAKVGLGVGIAGAAVAGFYWYKELSSSSKKDGRKKAIVPMVDEDSVGATAIFSF